jgi:flagellar basal-body rod protein FlgB
MLDSLFAPAAPLQEAMGYEAARQRVIAHNIANVNTPGYEAKDLFRTVLSQSEDEFSRLDRALDAIDSEPPPPYEVVTLSDPPVRPDGNNVNLESQLANLAEVELRFRALTGLTSRYFRDLSNVIAGRTT